MVWNPGVMVGRGDIRDGGLAGVDFFYLVLSL